MLHLVGVRPSVDAAVGKSAGGQAGPAAQAELPIWLSAVALYRCHEALELDGQAHGDNADEWLSAV